MKMKAFFVYIEDGHDVFKVIVPAIDEEDARNYVSGNGEVILVKEAHVQIDQYKLGEVLHNGGFSALEADLISRVLMRVGLL